MSNKTEIFFPDGVIGFSNYKQYVIIPEKSKEPFYWMQSVKDSELSFIIIKPEEFKPDYQPVLSDADKSILKINTVEDYQLFTIVSIAEGTNLISVNLLAPLVINFEENIGIQVVLQNQDYSVRDVLLDEITKEV